MRFAIINGLRSEATSKARGVCGFCQGELVAHCGKYKIWHWAHKTLAVCDRWWETETDWHRDWKNNFPKDWQEVILQDPNTGERHIADVRTPFEVVIEFQRSTIEPMEVKARENFYKKIVWIIDGTRNEMDVANFLHVLITC